MRRSQISMDERMRVGIDQRFNLGIAKNGTVRCFDSLSALYASGEYHFLFGVSSRERAESLIIATCKHSYDGNDYLHNRAHELATADELRSTVIVKEIQENMIAMNHRLNCLVTQ